MMGQPKQIEGKNIETKIKKKNEEKENAQKLEESGKGTDTRAGNSLRERTSETSDTEEVRREIGIEQTGLGDNKDPKYLLFTNFLENQDTEESTRNIKGVE